MKTPDKDLYLEDLAVGMTLDSGTLEVTIDEITRFAAEFDPQPFHTDPEAAKSSFFEGLAASGWHTAALTMRLLVQSVRFAGGLIGAGVDELRWPRPVRPGDVLRIRSEILEIRTSKSRPDRGMAKVRTTTYNQKDEAVQISTANIIVLKREV